MNEESKVTSLGGGNAASKESDLAPDLNWTCT
jgi:hypothetical protein